MELKRFETTCLAYLHSRKFTLQAKLKNVKPHHRDSNQGPSAYRADALTTAPWCCSHPQRRKHDIFQLACTYLQPHTTQVDLRPQTIVGSATFLVKLPSRRTLDFKETDTRSFCNFKRFETTCLAYLHSRKFTLQAKLKNETGGLKPLKITKAPRVSFFKIKWSYSFFSVFLFFWRGRETPGRKLDSKNTGVGLVAMCRFHAR